MIKRFFLIGLLAASFAIPTQAQGTFVPSLLRLRDDTNHSAILLVKENGDYLLTFNVDALRVESHGTMRRIGCSLVMEEVTERYRVVVAGDVCNRTGKAVLQIFGLGTFTIVDKTRDGQVD